MNRQNLTADQWGRTVGAIVSVLGLLALLLIAFPLLAGGAGVLEISKSAPAVADAGAVIEYTITVTNGTAQTITKAVVRDSVPLYTAYVSGSMTSQPGVLTPTQPPAIAAGSAMTWTVASLVAGDSISMTFQVTVGQPLISGTEVYNTATVSGTSDNVTTTVHGTASLTVTKTVEPSQVGPGDVVSYTLRLTNTGNGVAQGVTIADGLPLGFQPTKKVWAWQHVIDVLTLTLTATVPTAEGTYHNLVTVTYGGADITTGPTAPVNVRSKHAYLPLIIRNYPPPAPSWHQGGQTAGLTVYRVASCPDTCQVSYAATRANGVWSSQDGGKTWAPSGLAGTRINWVELQPGDCGVAYAATWGRGVQKKTGAGGTWQPANAGLGDLHVYVLAIAPDGRTFYAGTASRGVYKSLDAGGSWAPANTGLPVDKPVDALVIDPDEPQTLYAGLWGQGVYRSADGGTTWTAKNVGLGAQEIYALAFDPSDSQIVYAATSEKGVYRSGDGADHWLQDGLPGQRVYSVAAGSDGLVYAGIDGTLGGSNGKGLYVRIAPDGWAAMAPQPFASPMVRNVFPCHNVLFVGTDDGVWWYGRD